MLPYYISINKYIKILLIILVILSLTSCSDSKTTSLDQNNPTTVSLWHHYKGSQMKILQEQIMTFNKTVGKEKGITVNEISMRSPQEIYDQMILATNKEPGAPQLPSLAMMYPDAAFTLNELHILSPYNQYLSGNQISLYIDSFIEEGKITNTDDIYLFPISKSSEVLMINNTAYQKFLTDYNTSNPEINLDESMLATFEGILKTAKAYYDWTDAKTPDIPNDGKALFGIDSPCNFSIAGYHQLGDDFFKENDTKIKTINFDSPSFKKIWDHYYIPMVKGYFAAYSFYRAEDTQTGDIIMYIGSTGGASFFPSTVTYQDNTKEDVQLKVLPFPRFEDGINSAVQQGAGIALSKTSPEEEYAATVFLTWLTSAENNTDFILGSGYLPVTKEAFENTLPNEIKENNETIQEINISKVIKLTSKTYNDIGFYTYKPFKNSEDIRFFFEDFFLDKANEAHEYFLNYLKKGHTFEEATSHFLNDYAMENFIEEAKNELSEIQN